MRLHVSGALLLLESGLFAGPLYFDKDDPSASNKHPIDNTSESRGCELAFPPAAHLRKFRDVALDVTFADRF
jgi:hypothetical protein